MANVVIEMSGTVKSFGSTRALDGFDLSVAQGEVHGFLGPNGAGKSTALRVLLGALRLDAGTALLFGGDPWSAATDLHRRLAYVPGDVSLWPNLTGGEVIDLLGRLRGGLDAGRRSDLIERFGLDPSKRSRTYSKGNRQKVALISALASPVELFLLDEPTAGLDPVMESVFREVIVERKAAGDTVLLSSHILSEVEALADRLTIIRRGRAVETGSVADMRHLSRTSVVAVVSASPDGLLAGDGVHDLVIDEHRVSASVDGAALGGFLSGLSELGVRSLTSAPPTLEDLFLRHYKEG